MVPGRVNSDPEEKVDEIEEDKRDDKKTKKTVFRSFKIPTKDELEKMLKMRTVDYWKQVQQGSDQKQAKVASLDKGVDGPNKSARENTDGAECESNGQHLDGGDGVNNQQQNQGSALSSMVIETENDTVNAVVSDMVEAVVSGCEEQMILVPRAIFQNIVNKMDEQSEENKHQSEQIKQLIAATQHLIGIAKRIVIATIGGGNGVEHRAQGNLAGAGGTQQRRPVPGVPKCNACGKEFSSASARCIHIQMVHDGKVWKCQYCGKPFASPSMKSKHLKREHSDVHVFKESRKRKMEPTTSRKKRRAVTTSNATIEEPV